MQGDQVRKLRADRRLVVLPDQRPGEAVGWIGRVIDGGAMPASVPGVFLVRPVRRPAWPEAAGAEADPQPEPGAGPVPVLILGPSRPKAGDLAQAWPIGRGRWAGGIAPAPDRGEPLPWCCQLNTDDEFTLTRVSDGKEFDLYWRTYEVFATSPPQSNPCQKAQVTGFMAVLDYPSWPPGLGPQEPILFEFRRFVDFGGNTQCQAALRYWSFHWADPQRTSQCWAYAETALNPRTMIRASCDPLLLSVSYPASALPTATSGQEFRITRAGP